MADHCKRIFGDKLLRDPIAEHPLQEGQELPSPNSLKYKIIIKNKRLNMDDERRALGLGWKLIQLLIISCYKSILFDLLEFVLKINDLVFR